MPEPLDAALVALRAPLLDLDALVRAVASGHRRGARPQPARAELRPVDLKTGRRLQVVTSDGRTPTTRNHRPGPEAEAAVDSLLAEPFGNWHVETLQRIVQLRVTKKGQAQVHRCDGRGPQLARAGRTSRTAHDRVKTHLIEPDDPIFAALGANAGKRRQVDAFLRLLAPVLPRALARAREQGRPLHVVDLGCGNAYLTFAAHRYLLQHPDVADLGVRTIGVDVRREMVERNARIAGELGFVDLTFQAATIEEAVAPGAVDVVLALHACDTATDDALAQAVRWGAGAVLAAPCCHHDLQRQLGRAAAAGVQPPSGWNALTGHGILRERLADVLTDALRADILRLLGFRVDVVEFVESRHTPRNTLLRAERTERPERTEHPERPPDDAGTAESYSALAAAWHVEPALARLLAAELGQR